MRAVRHAVRFPWRPGSRFELLLDGTIFFAGMLETIESARHIPVPNARSLSRPADMFARARISSFASDTTASSALRWYGSVARPNNAPKCGCRENVCARGSSNLTGTPARILRADPRVACQQRTQQSRAFACQRTRQVSHCRGKWPIEHGLPCAHAKFCNSVSRTSEADPVFIIQSNALRPSRWLRWRAARRAKIAVPVRSVSLSPAVTSRPFPARRARR